jgi:hypothetical protein
MAKKTSFIGGLPDGTPLDIVRVSKSGEVIKKEMTYREWRGLKKQTGYIYLAYQKNFSQFN